MCLAVPGRIKEVRGEAPILREGRVDFDGIVKDVNLSFTPEAGVGDYVMVHVGFAISTVDEVEAKRVFEELRKIGEMTELDEDPS